MAETNLRMRTPAANSASLEARLNAFKIGGGRPLQVPENAAGWRAAAALELEHLCALTDILSAGFELGAAADLSPNDLINTMDALNLMAARAAFAIEEADHACNR